MNDIERIIIHWTGGAHEPNHIDKAAYHFLVTGKGERVLGDLRPEDNFNTKPPYAAHTRGLNTGSIGIAVCAMLGAREVPFDWGDAPITTEQVEALCKWVAELCDEWDIPVSPETVLTHAEVEDTLGVWQRNKWDITILPGMRRPTGPRTIGDKLRSKVRQYQIATTMAPAPVTFWGKLKGWFS